PRRPGYLEGVGAREGREGHPVAGHLVLARDHLLDGRVLRARARAGHGREVEALAVDLERGAVDGHRGLADRDRLQLPRREEEHGPPVALDGEGLGEALPLLLELDDDGCGLAVIGLDDVLDLRAVGSSGGRAVDGVTEEGTVRVGDVDRAHVHRIVTATLDDRLRVLECGALGTEVPLTHLPEEEPPEPDDGDESHESPDGDLRPAAHRLRLPPLLRCLGVAGPGWLLLRGRGRTSLRSGLVET